MSLSGVRRAQGPVRPVVLVEEDAVPERRPRRPLPAREAHETARRVERAGRRAQLGEFRGLEEPHLGVVAHDVEVEAEAVAREREELVRQAGLRVGEDAVAVRVAEVDVPAAAARRRRARLGAGRARLEVRKGVEVVGRRRRDLPGRPAVGGRDEPPDEDDVRARVRVVGVDVAARQRPLPASGASAPPTRARGSRRARAAADGNSSRPGENVVRWSSGDQRCPSWTRAQRSKLWAPVASVRHTIHARPAPSRKTDG